MAEPASGRCACGAVRYRVTGELRQVWNCHCPRCRRVTGHFLAGTAARSDQVHVDGDAAVHWWSPDGTVAYGFCGTCGSTMFWRDHSRPHHLVIAAGTLDTPTGLTTTTAWWCAEASDYHRRQSGLVEYDYES
jgi:hypothetical protein